MKLNVHGCRGSVPVQSRGQTRYGGNTSCFEVTFGQFQIFFDTGTGFRTAQFGGPEITKILLYSHWHHDHVQGFAFNPNIFVPDHKVLVASGLSSADVSRQMLQQYFSGSYFPIDVIGSLENIIFHEFEYIKENFINDFKLNNRKPTLRSFCKPVKIIVEDGWGMESRGLSPFGFVFLEVHRRWATKLGGFSIDEFMKQCLLVNQEFRAIPAMGRYPAFTWQASELWREQEIQSH